MPCYHDNCGNTLLKRKIKGGMLYFLIFHLYQAFDLKFIIGARRYPLHQIRA